MIGLLDAAASTRYIPSNPGSKRAASSQRQWSPNKSHVGFFYIKKITWCVLKVLKEFVLTDLFHMTF